MAVFFQPACHGIVGHADRCFVFFFNDTATTEIYTIAYTLSLHDALPISSPSLLSFVVIVTTITVTTAAFEIGRAHV